MTKKWLCQTPTPPRIPIFYTLTKIHKPTPVGRPIISGCDGPTEKLSAFIDKLLQPITQKQQSYLKDTTDFINFLEKIKVPKNAILVSMDVTSLYTNIPQEEGIETVCRAYDIFYNNEPPVPTRLINRALRLILQENSFQFMEGHYLQTHGTAMGTKMAVAFANIFMAKIETEILSKTRHKPIAFKRFIDDVFCLWNINREHIDQFIEQCNNHHPTIKFTAEISEQEITFLDTNVYKGVRFNTVSILDVKTHFKPTETFQYTEFTSCHPPGVKKGFIKGEALRLLRTNSSRFNFEENITKFKRNRINRALRLILQENSFQFMEGHYLQTHGTAMGTKMAVAFANIFMAKIETEILSKTRHKPIAFKRFIDDVFCLWNINREHIDQFIEQCNNHHPTIKFTAEISEQEITFLDTNVYKGVRFNTVSILDVKTHFKPTETFQYTEFTSCHPPGVKKGFIKGEALRLLRTNSSRFNFEENITKFKRNLIARGYPERLIHETLSEVKFENRNAALTQKPKENKRILPFVTQYQPSVPNLKQILMKNWYLIEQQPLLKEIFKEPPIISYTRGRSLKDILVRAKL